MMETLIYENYKEPLKEVPREKGFGYYGVIALTEDRDRMQCHVCGEVYKNVSLHIRAHTISTQEYKEEFQLAKGTSLIGESTREKYQQTAFKRMNGEMPAHIAERNARIKSGEIVQPPIYKKLSLESRNKRGICPDQVLQKIKDLEVKLGHCPTVEEFKKEYKSRFLSPINFHFGGYNKACRAAKLVPRQDVIEYTDQTLLDKLKEFYKRFERMPMTSDFDRGMLPSARTYKNHFQTLNWARVEAGLGAVIPMHRGAYRILTPEEYIEYKAQKTSIQESR